eukprot:8335763-Alexandrium_andersonii.AAC.1
MAVPQGLQGEQTSWTSEELDALIEQPGEGDSDPLSIRIINLPLWYCDDKNFNGMMQLILGRELWQKVDFTSLPKHFDRRGKVVKKRPYGCSFGTVTFTDHESALLAYNHFGVRQLWGREIKAVSFDLSKLRDPSVKKRRETGVGRN